MANETSLSAHVTALDILLRALYAERARSEANPADFIDTIVGDMRTSLQAKLSEPDADDVFLEGVAEYIWQFGENVKTRF
ncbi:MAG: hypothetical protein ABJN39_09295 [Sulfitobacter sp.]|uniref:hypothetical protein n=1 Tax=Alphaproteobacteria TaxID=28211 RepID=UPI0029422221|nr:hypothetical protein [Sulfitobacter sp. LC.270.F.C4]WOI13569.1 hypothetical protein R1T45_01695 [Sulfitobacter sp. LC.270.F.C4]